MVAVRVYVEGGGDDNNTRARCREGFVKFFGKLLDRCHKPHVVACGGRGATFDAWRQAVKDPPNAFCILLVDSEAPVAPGAGPWQHLKQRDNWTRPARAADDHCHLMAQCMEAWFMADRLRADGAHRSSEG